MKKVMLAVMCAAMLFGTITTVYAEQGDWRGGIRARIHEAEAKIEHGINRGSITKPEARRLHKELNGILHKIDRMKEDGHLSQRERDVINRNLDKLDRDINREKSDHDKRR